MVVGVRIFLAGATGVLGMRLVPLFAAAGHEEAARRTVAALTGTTGVLTIGEG